MLETSFSVRVAASAAVFTCLLGVAQIAVGSERDEAAIRRSAARYLAAVNRGDFAAMRAHWTDEGNLIDESGNLTNVSDMPQTRDRSVVEPEASSGLTVSNSTIRFVTPEVAIEDGTSELANEGSASTRGRYTVVWVKREGKWLIDAVREAALIGGNPADGLQQLDWLIGEWAEEGANAVLKATFGWSPGKNYILGKLRIEPRDQEPNDVSMRIGVDAARGGIRSWNFDSDGGYSEGIWQRDGDGWIVNATGVLPDGSRAHGQRVLRSVDAESMLWESVNVQVDGQLVPDLRAKLVRQ